MNFVAQLNRLLEPIRNRIRMVVSRAIVTLIDDSTAIQLVQLSILQGEAKNRVERVQNYGFTSHPMKDNEAVVVFVNGNRDHGLVVAVDDSRYRLKNLPEGGVAVYDYDGNYVKLTKANGIEIEAPNQKVTVKASGDIEIGNTALKKLVNDTFKDLFNSHTHSGVGLTGTIAVPAGTCAITAGNVLAPNQQLTDSHLTNKVKAQ